MVWGVALHLVLPHLHLRKNINKLLQEQRTLLHGGFTITSMIQLCRIEIRSHRLVPRPSPSQPLYSRVLRVWDSGSLATISVLHLMDLVDSLPATSEISHDFRNPLPDCVFGQSLYQCVGKCLALN